MGQVWYLIVSIPDLYTLTYIYEGDFLDASSWDGVSFRLDEFKINVLNPQLFACFFHCLLVFFRINFLLKFFSGVLSECQTVWTQIRPGIILGLIWALNLCDGYQHTTFGDKELKR